MSCGWPKGGPIETDQDREIALLKSRLAKAVGALMVADEYLEFLASETNALDKKGERYLRWRESTNATKDLEET